MITCGLKLANEISPIFILPKSRLILCWISTCPLVLLKLPTICKAQIFSPNTTLQTFGLSKKAPQHVFDYPSHRINNRCLPIYAIKRRHRPPRTNLSQTSRSTHAGALPPELPGKWRRYPLLGCGIWSQPDCPILPDGQWPSRTKLIIAIYEPCTFTVRTTRTDECCEHSLVYGRRRSR